uniref:DUSP domain-containing protein n=1 Tax=Chaetoceros debilis TaxID=122233 RepID=A0A7S3QE19_9STRA
MGNCQSAVDHIQTQDDPNAITSSHSSPSLHFSENPHNESRWAQIYHTHHSRIVDPEDIHTVLDAAISASISHLRPAEMTLILRRIRKVVRTVMMSSQKVKTTKKKSNGYTISMNVMGGKRDKDKDKDKYSYNNGNSDMDSMDVRNLKSHAVYTKDHLLDEHVLRQIFVAGDRWIARGRKEKWVEQQYKSMGIRNCSTFCEDEDGDSSQYTDRDAESASAVVNGSSHRHPNGQIYDLNEVRNEVSKNKAKAMEREKRRGAKNGKKTGTAKISPASTSASEADAETVDMVGSAYILLLHLSESRWDHVAAIAKQSAQNAGLELDVNRQTALQEQRKKDNCNINGNASNSQSASAKQNSTNGHGNGNGNHMVPDVPPPPPMKAYNRAESNNSNGNGSNSSGGNGDNKNTHIPPPIMPSGVSFQSLSCLISSVLRANRRQRLIILFHLLLDPMTISQILNSHPNGGIPSWILECDQDWILSYASMSHDYYHGETLRVNVQNVIETISILLHSTNTSGDDSESERGNDQIHNNDSIDTDLEGANGMTNVNDIGAYAGVTVDGAAQTGIRQRALSYGDTKYHAAKMHVMLAGYLHQVREGEDAPSFENYTEGQWRDHLLNVFWKASRKYYHVEDEFNPDHVDGDQMAWTMKQFVAWADDAMPDDGALDVILHQVFGMGLLPTPAMERKLVAESWVEWQLREMHLFNADEYEMTDTISSMTSGIFNLLSFSSRDSTNDTDSVSGHDNIFNIDGGNGGQVRREMNGCAVWGGIGGFDGRGGLGNGIMYCIDKQWWQKWTQYVGWEWDDDNHNANSEYRKRGCSKDRPQELSSDRLVDHESDTFIDGSLGSYKLMKKELKNLGAPRCMGYFI